MLPAGQLQNEYERSETIKLNRERRQGTRNDSCSRFQPLKNRTTFRVRSLLIENTRVL